MGHWATYQRRGRVLTIAVLPGVELEALAHDPPFWFLGWSWSGGDPDHWRMERALSEAGPWGFYNEPPGADRDGEFPDGYWYRIRAEDAGDVPLSAWSNNMLAPA